MLVCKLLQQGTSEPVSYGDLVYKFKKKNSWKAFFSGSIQKGHHAFKKGGYNMDIMR